MGAYLQGGSQELGGERGGEVPEGFRNDFVSFSRSGRLSDGFTGKSMKNCAEPSRQIN